MAAAVLAAVLVLVVGTVRGSVDGAVVHAFMRAMELKRAGHTLRAVELLRDVVHAAQDPTLQWKARYNLASAYTELASQAGAFAPNDEAERLLREVLDRQPRHVPSLVRLGRLLGSRGQHDSAITLLQRAVDAASHGAHMPRYHYARALQQAGRCVDALPILREVARGSSDSIEPMAWLAAGECAATEARRLGSAALLEESAQCMREAVAASDGLPSVPRARALRCAALLGVGQAREELGHLERAMDAYRRATADPEEPCLPARMRAGELLRDMGRLEDAERELRAIIAAPTPARNPTLSAAAEVRMLALLPSAPQSWQHAARAWRGALARLSSALATHCGPATGPPPVHDATEPLQLMGPATPLYYLGAPVLRALHATSRLLRCMAPSLEFVAPGLRLAPQGQRATRSWQWHPAPAPGAALRVGFVSAHFRQHAVSRVMRPLILRLARCAPVSLTQLRLLSRACTDGLAGQGARRPRDPVLDQGCCAQVWRHARRIVRRPLRACPGDSRAARGGDWHEPACLACSHCCSASACCCTSRPAPLPTRAHAWRQLDVLVFTDIGMDSVTYALAHARLAPAQVSCDGPLHRVCATPTPLREAVQYGGPPHCVGHCRCGCFRCFCTFRAAAARAPCRPAWLPPASPERCSGAGCLGRALQRWHRGAALPPLR